MKGFLIAVTLGLGLLGASIATAGSALAEGREDRQDGYREPGYNFFGALIYGAPRHKYRRDNRRDYRPDYRRDRHDYRRKHHRARRHHHRERFANSVPQRSYGQKRMDYRATRPCHATNKIGFAQGRRARIGGTMCYDTYGTPYIVKGSRYIIQYY